jgi:hypothetical protein
MGMVDSAQPLRGLAEVVVGSVAWDDACLLGVSGSVLASAAATRVEWHVRGDDLIAAYEIGQPDFARIDISWRAAGPMAGASWLACIDLFVSVRTDRLDWRHDVSVESEMPGTIAVPEPFGRRGCSFFAQDRWSYAEFVHPADLRHDELTEFRDGPARCHLRRRLFLPETLEKGVILRARARGLFLPAAVAETTVAASYADFTAADPPLGV